MIFVMQIDQSEIIAGMLIVYNSTHASFRVV